MLQDPRVLDAMLPYFVTQYGNPHSRTHAYGWESEAAVEHARKVRYIKWIYRKFLSITVSAVYSKIEACFHCIFWTPYVE